MITVTIWDLATGNLVGGLRTAEDARTFIREMTDAFGTAALDPWVVEIQQADGTVTALSVTDFIATFDPPKSAVSRHLTDPRRFPTDR